MLSSVMGGICLQNENSVIHHVSDCRPVKKNAHVFKGIGESWCQAGQRESVPSQPVNNPPLLHETRGFFFSYI